jgi:hypothetical protein
MINSFQWVLQEMQVPCIGNIPIVELLKTYVLFGGKK